MYSFDNNTYALACTSYLTNYLATDARKNMLSCYDDVILVFDGCVRFPPYLYFPPSLFCADPGADAGYRLVVIFF